MQQGPGSAEKNNEVGGRVPILRLTVSKNRVYLTSPGLIGFLARWHKGKR